MNNYGEQFAAQLFHANPQLGGVVPPRPDPASSASPCSASRVTQAGGIISELIVHPTFVPFEFLFRKLPEAGMFQATPERNFQATLGSFVIPEQMAFVFVDYKFNIFRPNGAIVGDDVPIEPQRLSSIMGYDVKIGGTRKANLRMEIDPQPIAATQDAFAPSAQPGAIATAGASQDAIASADFPVSFVAPAPTANTSIAPTQAQFNAANFARSTVPSGVGLSLLPQRTERVGPLAMPFTYHAKETERVDFEVVVFRGIPIPISFIEVDITGILMPANTLADMLEGMKPCVSQGGGR